MKREREWWHDLKVGDVVCDCRYRHSKIMRIEDERWLKPGLRWLVDWVEWLPYDRFVKLRHVAYRLEAWLSEFKLTSEIVDRLCFMDDGYHFHAAPCLSPADHPESDHNLEEDKCADNFGPTGAGPQDW